MLKHNDLHVLANSIRKHGRDVDILIDDICARLIPEQYRDAFRKRCSGEDVS